MPNYSKRHIEFVSERMRQHEQAQLSPEFVRLDLCDACITVNSCRKCLFCCRGDGERYPCIGPDGNTGHNCVSKEEQASQQEHLLSQLDKNGYEFK